MENKNIPFSLPLIGQEEIDEVVDTLRSGWLTTGPKTKRFETEFARYVGCRHAIAVNSCTAALHLALDAVGVGRGDIVVTTPMTFAATAEVIRYFGAKPVFVDIEKSTMNISPEALENTLKNMPSGEMKRTRAVIPVHMAGHPCRMDGIIESTGRYGLKVVEDAAHTLPAKYEGRSIGTIGDITAFSFYATKCITTGEGGMIATDNDAYAEKMRMMSLHGISKDAWKRYMKEGSWYYEIVYPGYKYNMPDLLAAIGIRQLEKADMLHGLREKQAKAYTEGFSGMPEIETPQAVGDVVHSWHLYIIRLCLEKLTISRDGFIEELKRKGVFASVHFIPLHMHPYYRNKYGYSPKDFPIASETYQQIVSLPFYPRMTEEETQYVINSVKEIIAGSRKKAAIFTSA